MDSLAEKAMQVTPTHLKKLLTAAIKHNLQMLITGAPGIGKTYIIVQICKALGIKCFISHPTISDPTDYKGYPYINKDGTAVFVPFGDLKQLIDYKETAVFFMDDMGQATQAVQAALMQLVWGGRINSHAIGNNITFMGASNRKKDKSGVTGMLDSLRSRFTVVELVPTIEDWTQWANMNNLPFQLIGFIRSQGMDALWNFKPTFEFESYPNPRSVETVGKWIQTALPIAELIAPITGNVGYPWFKTFEGWMKMAERAINPNLILTDPNTAPIPQELDSTYAVCASLASFATDKNFGKIVKYAERLEDGTCFDDGKPRKEFANMMVNDCGFRNDSVKETPGWIQWQADHPELNFSTELEAA